MIDNEGSTSNKPVHFITEEDAKMTLNRTFIDEQQHEMFKIMAHYAGAVYCRLQTNWTCAGGIHTISTPNTVLLETHNDDDTSLYFAWHPAHGYILSVRGTSTRKDKLRTLNFLPVDFDFGESSNEMLTQQTDNFATKPKVHRGFHGLYLSKRHIIRSWILKHLSQYGSSTLVKSSFESSDTPTDIVKEYAASESIALSNLELQTIQSSRITRSLRDHTTKLKLTFVGHSAGGAVVTMMSQYFLHSIKKELGIDMNEWDVRLFTFGSPRSGDARFVEVLKSSGIQIWSVLTGNDIVPMLPFHFLSFRHYPIYYLSPSTHSPHIFKCDSPSPSSGEDNECYNYRTSLGFSLLQGIANHLRFGDIVLGDGGAGRESMWCDFTKSCGKV
ncbi:Alpha/Beta hydrolase protein [Paraphysoderma sedebokerense]|nr:Alpha/Beta hydrolase protein [Paraphysoderma sedebokerense]KAI9140042.1 Alpha/Beta hydrolase protein [Paraphysoderma sedebokerense]